MNQNVDVVIVGAGAAGLMTGIWAGRTDRTRSIMVVDGAKKIGAKILVAGGGRCNVTHDVVTETAYAGASRNAIKKVLRRFDVPETVAFFDKLGVTLKREETGKLFPTTDKARSVLDALLRGVRQAGVALHHPVRVDAIERMGNGRFVVSGAWGTIETKKVVLATGGRSLPKSGSDGHGYKLAQALGHSVTDYIFPALVPLTLPRDHWICQLSGITLPAAFDLWSETGKRLQTFTNSTLCTHFGLSGPAVLDVSRYYIDAARASATLTVNWLPALTLAEVDKALQTWQRPTISYLREHVPDRMARALCEAAAIDGQTRGDQLRRDDRKRLAKMATRLPLPITGNRGYNYAEVTAGGVPLTEITLKTMESRLCPGLYFAGEICDVDGRIGGYNFQWAWASGYAAGISV